MDNSAKNYATEGQGAVLVIVNSAGNYWDYSILDETIFSALRHFGIPYRMFDIGVKKLTADDLEKCVGVILGQCRLGEGLGKQQAELIANAVQEEGIGCVNFDNELEFYPPVFLEMLGIEKVNRCPFATNIIRIKTNVHYITEMQDESEFHEFDKMIAGTLVEKWRKDVEVLAEGVLGKEQLIYIRHFVPHSAFEPRNYPVVLAGKWGKGKTVQFMLNPRLWRKGIFGHARGIDDLFWRSIVWAMRKPFVAHLIPPFVTMSFDDCSGRYDFKYVDIARKYGYIPMPSLFIKEVPKSLFRKIKEDVLSSKVQYNTHALSYYELLTFDFGRGELTHEKLKENFAIDDEFWNCLGVRPSIVNRIHWGEYGVKGLRFLKERGRTFFCPVLQPGLIKANQNMNDGYGPYNLNSCYYDFLPFDKEIFAFSAFPGRYKEDFLVGTTTLLRENKFNDIEKSARSGAEILKLGLRSGFFGELCTHEQKFDVLNLDEWEAILLRINQMTKKFEKIYVGHDEIAKYLKSKCQTRLAHVDKEGHFQLAGQADVPLRVSIFTEQDGKIIRQYEETII